MAAITAEEAWRQAASFVAKLASAENPAAARRAVRGEITFGQLYDAYLKDRITAGKKRPDLIRGLWERYLGPLPDEPRKAHSCKREKPAEGVDWSTKRVSEITVSMLVQLHRRICAAGKGRTGNMVIGLVRAIYGYGLDHRIVTENPVVGVTFAPECERDRFVKGTSCCVSWRRWRPRNSHGWISLPCCFTSATGAAQSRQCAGRIST